MYKELKQLLYDEYRCEMSDELFDRFIGVATEVSLKNGEPLIPYDRFDPNVYIHKSGLKVFTNTEVAKFKKKSAGYVLQTTSGYKINSKYVIIAAGFEAGRFLPKQVMKLGCTAMVLKQKNHIYTSGPTMKTVLL